MSACVVEVMSFHFAFASCIKSDRIRGRSIIALAPFHPCTCVKLKESPLTLDILGPRSSFHMSIPECHRHLGHVTRQRSGVTADTSRG